MTDTATWLSPDFTTQTGTTYKTAIDGAINTAKRYADHFAPHEANSPNMSVVLDAGHILAATTLTEIAAQTSTTIVAPTTHPRIDRIVVDSSTGTLAIITGTEAGSPIPPTLTGGSIPIAQVLLQTTSTAIVNSMITDERVLWVSSGDGPSVNSVTATTSTTTLATAGYSVAIVALQHSTTLTLSPGVDGQSIRIRLAQDGTGGRTVSFDASVVFGSDITSFAGSTAANKTDEIGLIYNAANTVWQFLAFSRGF